MTRLRTSFVRSSLAHILIIMIMGGTLLLLNLGSRPLGGSEGRWGEISREMLLKHDWIVPKINGIPYRDKPVGSYWPIALLSLPKNHVTETTSRLPSALSVLLSAIMLYLITRAFWEREAAFMASMIFITTYPIIFWGRTANADTPTIAGTLVCVWFFVRQRNLASRETWWLYPFFVIAGITSLMKGLLGFVLPSLVVFPYLLIKGREAFSNKRFLTHLFLAAILGIILFLVPFILDFEKTHSGVSLYLVFRENIIRFFRPFDHKGPFFYYFYYIFVTVSPWSLLIPFLALHLKRRRTLREEGVFFFGLWFILLFTFFTLSGSKRGYYLMPVVPSFAALLGFSLYQAGKGAFPARVERFLIIFPAILIIISGLLLLFLPFFPTTAQIPGSFLQIIKLFAPPVGGILILTGVVSLLPLIKGKINKGIYTLGFGIFLFLCIAFWFAFPAIARKDPFVPFCRKVNDTTRGSNVAVYGSANRSILYFYLSKVPVPYFTNPEMARDFLYKHPRSFLIVKGRNRLGALGGAQLSVLVAEEQENPDGYLLVTARKGP